MSHISFVEIPCSVVSSKVLIVDCRPLSCSATPISLFVHTETKNAIPSVMPAVVMIERPKRIFKL